ncbi:MAG: peptidoglycan-binding protein [Verrucomicrobia bacterium]|nr:peptidoglycan-binding protein [Verrucomicrobiota bacterium]
MPVHLYTKSGVEQTRKVMLFVLGLVSSGLAEGGPASAAPGELLPADVPPSTNALPVPARRAAVIALNFAPRPVQNGYEAQLALARQGISPGSLDGVIGPQTRAALRAFQEKEGLPMTGQLDPVTKARLILTESPERIYTVTGNDLARLLPVGATWLAKSQQERLDFETILELLAERGQASQNLIRLLNPSIDWANVTAGTSVVIPNVPLPPVRAKAETVRIRLSERILQAFDERNALLAHFPCSIARQLEKRPMGELFVEKIAGYPTYRFDPENFPESAEARRLGRILDIAPGPNNPVGTAWIGLNLPGYGIHGSPRPEEVGRTESHGCFRLANWNAEYLAQLVRVGTRVIVEP